MTCTVSYRRNNDMKKGWLLLSGLSLGAGAMYLLDPDYGQRRRKQLRTNARAARYRVSDFLDETASGVQGRARSAYAGTRAQLMAPHWLDVLPSRHRRRQKSMDSGLLVLGGLGVGVALLTLVGAQKSSREKTAAVTQKTIHDAYDWMCGMITEGRAWLRQEMVPDAVLVPRVKDRLNRLASRPGAIDVSADRGRITLSGPVLERERDTVLSSIASMRGVSDVVDKLDVQERTTTYMGVQDRPKS